MKHPNQPIFSNVTKAILLGACLGVLLVASIQLNAAPGDGHWDRQFGLPGVTNRVDALRFKGDLLYASGYAVGSGGALATNTGVDIFDGTNWSRTIGEITGSLLIIYDFGFIGNDVYVAGIFSKAGGVSAPGLAKWDGNQWSNVGGFAGAAFALVSEGTNLYVGGTFTNAGGVLNTNIAKWDGTSWSSLGGGLGYYSSLGNYVNALELHNGVLYAAGIFTNAGSVPIANLARWDGANWSSIGGGVNGMVSAISFQGDDLYAGGSFTAAGGVAALNIAKWDGSVWSPLGSGVKAPPSGGTPVTCIGIVGTDVYVGGGFTNAGGLAANSFAKWDGSSWTSYGTLGNSGVQYPLNGLPRRMQVKSGSLYVGGEFNTADDIIANHVARFDGTDWHEVGEKPANGFVNVGFVQCIGQADDGIYVGGLFTAAGKTKANRIARWDGTDWFALDSGTGGGIASANIVRAIAGRGSEVFVGGKFTSVGGSVTVSNIAKWDGASWSAMGIGFNDDVFVIDTTASDVYAGGRFTLVNDPPDIVTVNRIARWDGFNWYPLGFGVNNNVNAIATTASGNVYAGGTFTNADGNTANRIAMWDGGSWSSLGSGSANGVNGSVFTIAVQGTDVYAGGSFTTAGGISATGIAKWDGASWSTLGSGVTGPSSPRVTALAFAGNKLYASGQFTNISGVNANGIARWDGTKWEPLGSGVFSTTVARASGFAVRGDDVYIAGTFDAVGVSEAGSICRWNENMDFTPPSVMRFSNTQLLPGGLFKSRITATERAAYVLEYSDNFQNWNPLMTNSASQLDFTNGVSFSVKRRVYRTREIP